MHTTGLNIYLCYMIAENTQTQMRKGILDYCILSIISQGEIYASDILSELKKARLLVVEGTLYPLLTRLKNNGLLSYNWRESTSGPRANTMRLRRRDLKCWNASTKPGASLPSPWIRPWSIAEIKNNQTTL